MCILLKLKIATPPMYTVKKNSLQLVQILIFGRFCFRRRSAKTEVQPAQAQAEPEAAHALHHAAADVAGEEVPREAVPVDRRACRVLQFAAPDGDAGQDLVPEPPRQGQAAAGGGNREAAPLGTPPSAGLVRPLPPPGARLVLRGGRGRRHPGQRRSPPPSAAPLPPTLVAPNTRMRTSSD
jgi:hypothetical protein